MHKTLRSSRRLAAAPVVLVATLLLANPSRADVDFGGRAGAYTDESRPFFGAELLTSLDRAHDWYVNPNFEYAADEQSDLVTLNCDFHYDFATEGRYTAWFGGGPALLFLDREIGDDDSDLGLNVLAGFGAKRGEARPYFQAKVIVADDATAVLGVGVRF